MKKLNLKKHMMTGISYMIPMIVAGGILGALAKGFGGWEVGNYAPEAGATIFTNLNCFDWKQFWWMISKLSDYAMSFGVAVMTAGVCYSPNVRASCRASLSAMRLTSRKPAS